ncbi:uncharacterized protein EV154DRAFT_557577 [Mucor mucedo]|uniref:uncharacterized protein n=1 Tax=Mucor mucedo TaxID=29922 RepID=UPI002220E419|nr:uncharacterized protein EV154DRAFT_557577 [Mucor mucedo]KAI7897253.1 hypothetical protein EV154DRAFT_557577 [Mucor mucedo]
MFSTWPAKSKDTTDKSKLAPAGFDFKCGLYNKVCKSAGVLTLHNSCMYLPEPFSTAVKPSSKAILQLKSAFSSPVTLKDTDQPVTAKHKVNDPTDNKACSIKRLKERV